MVGTTRSTRSALSSALRTRAANREQPGWEGTVDASLRFETTTPTNPKCWWLTPEALAAGVSIFELARLMGTSVAMIDRTYGHLARDSESAIRARLDARAGRSGVDLASESERT
jgi:hypothetical protein